MQFNILPLDALSSKTKAKIIKFLLNHEASMSEREISSILKVSHMSVNRAMRELSGINFVDFTAIGKAHLWKVNRQSYAFKVLSEFMEGALRIKGPLDDLRGLLLRGLPKTLIRKAVLFGSIAQGTEKAGSDIDVFLLVRDERDKEKLGPFLDKLSSRCLQAYGNRLSPYVLTEQELKQKKGLKLIPEINKGIQIFPRGKRICYGTQI